MPGYPYQMSAGYGVANYGVAQPYQQNYTAPQINPGNGPLQGRMVASKEEVLAVPVDFMGTPMFFPDLGHGVVYCKKFNPNTGAADLFEFRLPAPPTPAAQQPQATTANDEVQALKKRVDDLENELLKIMESKGD